MAISKSLEEAVEKRDMASIYSSFYTILLSDPGFTTRRFDEALEYVKSKGIQGFIQIHNGKKFLDESKWDEKYWDKLTSELIDNFSMERINHLKKVAERVYSHSNNNEEDDSQKFEQKKTNLAQRISVQPKKDSGGLIVVGMIIIIILVSLIILIVSLL